MRTYTTVALIAAASVGAMAWSAIKPGDGIGTQAYVVTQDAIRATADWFRRGPADGRPDWEAAAFDMYDADADHGAALMLQYGCGSCHAIPGVAGARGSVGPSLEGFRDRAYVAGVLPNRPGDLVRWLINPPLHAPQTAMPDLGVTEAEARDMAAYLYTLRGG
ncbi:c-type cytochrome [Marivita sp. S0852]|uniref:c-type cytochrome n=1 Tax=Marivita sp. S0852 TaxID=3373893 RepID=UPI003982821D